MPVSVAKKHQKVRAAALRLMQLSRQVEEAVGDSDAEEMLDAEYAARDYYENALDEFDRARLLVNAKQRRKRSRWSAETRERKNASKRAVRALRQASS